MSATTAHLWTGARCRGDRLLVTLPRRTPQGHPKHEEILHRHSDSRSGICHTTFVPITTSQNLSDELGVAPAWRCPVPREVLQGSIAVRQKIHDQSKSLSV